MSAILGVLQKKGVASHCEPGAYYLVNNYGAGYDLDGHPQPLGTEELHVSAADGADHCGGAE